MNSDAPTKKLVAIYRCQRKEGAYVYLEKGRDWRSLPAALLRQTGRLAPAMTLLLTVEKKLARADAGKVLAAIDARGFYLQMPPAAEKTDH